MFFNTVSEINHFSERSQHNFEGQKKIKWKLNTILCILKGFQNNMFFFVVFVVNIIVI